MIPNMEMAQFLLGSPKISWNSTGHIVWIQSRIVGRVDIEYFNILLSMTHLNLVSILCCLLLNFFILLFVFFPILFSLSPKDIVCCSIGERVL